VRKGLAHLVEGLHPVWTVEAPLPLGISGTVSRPAETRRPRGEQLGCENEWSFPSRGEVKCHGAVPPCPLDDSML
jgi:hypothetical protein